MVCGMDIINVKVVMIKMMRAQNMHIVWWRWWRDNSTKYAQSLMTMMRVQSMQCRQQAGDSRFTRRLQCRLSSKTVTCNVLHWMLHCNGTRMVQWYIKWHMATTRQILLEIVICILLCIERHTVTTSVQLLLVGDSPLYQCTMLETEPVGDWLWQCTMRGNTETEACIESKCNSENCSRELAQS